MIGILNAYHFDTAPGNFQEDYCRLILGFMNEIATGLKLGICEYKFAQGHYPGSVNDCAMWIITGSPKGVHDDIPWIHKLCHFTKELHLQRKKTVGICFGHQMIAHALGGTVAKRPGGWGVGIRDFAIYKHTPWMKPDATSLALPFSHQDQVDSLPPGAEPLGGDGLCANQLFQIGNHMLSMQGHPEFSVGFAMARLLSRKGEVTPEVFETAMQSYSRPTDRELLIQWIGKFLDQ